MEGGEEVDLSQPSPTAPPVSLLLPQATPTNQQGPVYPPPYPGPPIGSPTTPQSQAQPLTPKLDPSLPPPQHHSGPLAPQFSGGAAPQPPQIINTPTVTENIIILKDGTRILIRSKDEYQFTGPGGQQMVVNCLPLFVPRPEDTTTKTALTDSTTVTNEASKDAHSTLQKKQARRGTKAAQRFVLQKAASTESILTPTTPVSSPHLDKRKHSSEAEDILSESGKNSVQVLRDTWSHYNSSSCGMNEGVTASGNTTTSTVLATGNVVVDGEVQASEVEGERGGDVSVVGGTEVGASGEEGAERDESDGTSQPLSDGGSEGEKEKEVRISYIENPDEMQRLSRSSGSVSFISNDRPMVRGRSHPSSSPPPSVEEETRETTDMGEQARDEVEGAVLGGEGGEGSVKEGGGEGGGDGVKEGGGEGAGDGVKEGGGEDGVKEGGGEGGEDVKEGSGEGVDGEEGEGVEIDTTGDKSPEGDNHHQDGDALTEIVGLTQSSPSLTPTAPPPASTDPAHSTQTASPPGLAHSTQTPVTPLPPPPATFEPQFIERSGWLMKLSHRRGNYFLMIFMTAMITHSLLPQ